MVNETDYIRRWGLVPKVRMKNQGSKQSSHRQDGTTGRDQSKKTVSGSREIKRRGPRKLPVFMQVGLYNTRLLILLPQGKAHVCF